MAYIEEQHGELLRSLLNVMTYETFADLKVRLRDGEVIGVSHLVVAAMSPVFRQMLTSPMHERNEGEIELDYVSKEAWDTLVAFHFAGEKQVTAGNVVETVEVAHLLQMKSLTRHCRKVLSESVDLENWWTFLEIANKYDFEDCTQNILRFVGRNFEAVTASEIFYNLPKKNFEDLLGEPFCVRSEDVVCQAVLSWMEHNHLDEDAAVELFDLISLEDVSTECFISRVMYHPQVLSFDRIKRKLIAEFQRRCPFTAPAKTVYERPPKPLQNTVILGHDGHSMRMFGSSKGPDAWQEVPGCGAGDRFATCMLDGCIYVSGGHKTRNSTFLFNLQTKAWSTGPELSEGRSSHAMAKMNQSVFVVGGFNYPKRFLTSIEEMPDTTKAWRTIGHLVHATSSCGVAAVDDTLIVIGGVPRDAQSTLQAFNHATSTASVLETRLMRPVFRARGAEVAGGAVFVSQSGDLFFVKLSGDGKPAIDFTDLRGFGQKGVFGLLVDSHVTVFGGGRDIDPGSAVERFTLDGERDVWKASPLPVPLRVGGVFRTKQSLM